MNKTNPAIEVPDEIVMSKIYLIRGRKVMLDRDLAELFYIKATRLREQENETWKNSLHISCSD